MIKKIDTLSLIFTFLAGLLLLFIIAPVFGMFLSTAPVEVFDVALDPEVQSSVGLTLWTSMFATLLFSIGAIPLAYLLARKKFPLRKLLIGIINIPVIIPHSAAGIALLGVVSRDTMLGKFAESLGISFVNHPAGIVVAMAFISIPYLVNASIDGFMNVPERLELVAQNLGASKTRAFFTIALPLAWRNILTGLTMMWGRGLSEFGAIVIIAYHPMVTPVMIFERFNAYGLSYARPVTVLFIAICLLIFVGLNYNSKKRRNA